MVQLSLCIIDEDVQIEFRITDYCKQERTMNEIACLPERQFDGGLAGEIV